jgi:hypothetical protein
MLVDKCHRPRLGYAMRGIEGLGTDTHQFGELQDSRLTSGWALVDVSPALRNGGGVRAATRETALAALRLRQDCI